MAKDTVINLTGGLRRKLEKEGRTARHRDKFIISLKSDDIKFRANETNIAQYAAEVIGETIKQNMRLGKRPNGKPMPSADADTMKRRAYREQQYISGAKRTTQKVINRAKRNLERRIKAPKLGRFPPGRVQVHGRRGLESGMLAESVVAAAEKDGTWSVFFASKRANEDKWGTSAVLRVFKGIGRVWDEAAMRQPEIQNALRVTARMLITGRARRGLRNIFVGLSRITRNTRMLAEEFEESADAR